MTSGETSQLASSKGKSARLLLWAMFFFIGYCYLTRILGVSYDSLQIAKDARPGGDGFYSWIFARSIAYDADIDLANDYALCGDPWHVGVDEGGGRPANPFYLGPALVWSPFLFLARRIVRLSPDASVQWTQACSGPLVMAVGAVASTVFCLLTLWLAYQIARRLGMREKPAMLATLTVGLGPPLCVFGPVWWVYSHAWAAFGVTLGVFSWLWARTPGDRLTRWFACGMAIGVAGLMRPHHVVWVILPMLDLAIFGLGVLRRRRVPWRHALRCAMVILGFVLVYSIQLAANKALYGRFLVTPQGKLYLQLTRPHVFLMLFSARSGFFVFAPMMWLAVFGLARALRIRGSALCRTTFLILFPLLIDIYICGSVLDYDGAATVGARRLTSFVGIAVPFIALFLQDAYDWVQQAPRRFGYALAASALAPALAASWNLTDGEPQAASAIYAGGVARLVDSVRAFGNPFAMPASIAFYWRYRLSPRVFEDITRAHTINVHHYRTGVALKDDTIDLAHPQSAVYLASGGTAEGLRAAPGAPGRFLSAMYWPYVTHIGLVIEAKASAVVTIRVGGALHTTEVASISVDPSVASSEVAVPSAAFSSGINEVFVESSEPIVVKRWQWIDRLEHDTRI